MSIIDFANLLHNINSFSPTLVLYNGGEMTTTLVYKDLFFIITKVVAKWLYVRERESQTAMIDTRLGQTYPEPCFYHGRFDTEQVLNPGAI